MLRNPFILVIAGIIILGFILYSLNAAFPGAFSFDDQGPSLVHGLLLLVLLGSAAIASGRIRVAEGLRYGAIWLLFLMVLVLGYSFRHELTGLGNRLTGALVPSAAVTEAPGVASIGKAQNGHFMVHALVKGPGLREERILFLVDTGATTVALSGRDARKLGIDTNTLTYDQITRTANGTARAARVTLPRIAVGPVVATDVRASVLPTGLEVSLLGHSFLDQLSAFEVSGDRLILRQ